MQTHQAGERSDRIAGLAADLEEGLRESVRVDREWREAEFTSVALLLLLLRRRCAVRVASGRRERARLAERSSSWRGSGVEFRGESVIAHAVSGAGTSSE